MNNRIIDTKPCNSERCMVKNTLKYSLFLDLRIPSKETDGDLDVDDIFEKCKNVCSKLLPENKSGRVIPERMFGRCEDTREDTLYRYLNPSRYKESAISEGDFFASCVKHDCVLSAYHTIVSELFMSECISPYAVANHYKYNGIQKLIEKERIIIERNDTVKILKMTEKDYRDSKKKSGVGANFRNKCSGRSENELIKVILNANGNNKDEAFGVYVQYAPLLMTLCEQRVVKWDHRLWRKSGNIEDFLETYRKMVDAVTPPKRKLKVEGKTDFAEKPFDGNATDAIYHYYLAEKLLNINLFYSIVENVGIIKKEFNYNMTDDTTIEALARTVNLPNVFSRTYFLRYAFDHIGCSDSLWDFWHRLSLYDNAIMMMQASESEKGFDYYTWIAQYKKFVNLMADFIFPVYEWSFLILLLERIELQNCDENHIHHLVDALRVLSDYIDKNYTKIIRPLEVKNPRTMDGLDIIWPKTYNVLGNVYKTEDLDKMRSKFYDTMKDLEIGIKQIDADSIAEKGNAFAPQVRNLYLRFMANNSKYNR